MVRTLFKLFQILTRRQRVDFYILQFFMLVTSVSELVGTVSIMPFMALAADPTLITSNQYYSNLYSYMGKPEPSSFLAMVGVVFVILIVLSNGLLLLSQFLMNRYSFRIGGEISVSLYNYYLLRDVNFHQKKNSASLTQTIMRDAQIISGSLIAPSLKLNARLFSIILLTSVLIYVDIIVAISSLLILGGTYFIVFQFVRKKIYSNGLQISEVDRTRNRLLNESLECIKDLKLHGVEHKYLSLFRLATRKSTRSSADNLILGESPYYFVETIVLSGVVFIILYFLAYKGSMQSILAPLTLYCMASLKLVPKMQQSYLAITRVRSAQAVFKRLYSDLIIANRITFAAENKFSRKLMLSKNISIIDLKYGYPEREMLFRGINLTFEAKKLTAIVGPSGIGKSTLLELIMGLLIPDTGSIQIDGKVITADLLPSWRRSIGYVPQSVYLSDDSIAKNIAFGVDKQDIDMVRVVKAAKMAGIANFIATLPDQYWTVVGERGALLSGGQKQRLGIARALYNDISVLLLDEATSALDNETQKNILQNLKSLEREMTIIMVTHRKETIAYADNIISLSDYL